MIRITAEVSNTFARFHIYALVQGQIANMIAQGVSLRGLQRIAIFPDDVDQLKFGQSKDFDIDPQLVADRLAGKRRRFTATEKFAICAQALRKIMREAGYKAHDFVGCADDWQPTGQNERIAYEAYVALIAIAQR